MQTYLQKIHQYQFIFYCLIIVAASNLIANAISEEAAILEGNLTYYFTSGALVILSIAICLRFKTSGKHGKAWILFAAFAITFFIAETTWSIEELVLDIDPFPSLADAFYLAGYPFLFSFMIFYLKPVKKGISKKILGASIVLSAFVLIPTLYVTIDSEIEESSSFEIAIAASYPIADAIVLAPALIGLTLFFKGEVNFLWALMCLGIICMAIADIGFLITNINMTYYTGHPIEILFHWQYILWSFGVYSHIQIFKKQEYDLSKYDNIEDLK